MGKQITRLTGCNRIIMRERQGDTSRSCNIRGKYATFRVFPNR